MPSALDDLKSIRDFIAKDSVYYADKFVDGAFKAAKPLEKFPKIGRMVPEMGNPALREIIYGSYRIIYELDNESKVQILTVVHSMRLLPNFSSIQR